MYLGTAELVAGFNEGAIEHLTKAVTLMSDWDFVAARMNLSAAHTANCDVSSAILVLK